MTEKVKKKWEPGNPAEQWTAATGIEVTEDELSQIYTVGIDYDEIYNSRPRMDLTSNLNNVHLHRIQIHGEDVEEIKEIRDVLLKALSSAPRPRRGR